MLTIEEVAEHWQLRPSAVRTRLKEGQLSGVKVGGRYRVTWDAIWPSSPALSICRRTCSKRSPVPGRNKR